MKKETKLKTISFKVGQKTLERLECLTSIYEIDQSKLLRVLIENEHEKLKMIKKLSKKELTNLSKKVIPTTR